MRIKVCSKCKQEKQLSEFYLRQTGKRAGKPYEICKNCFRFRGRVYYNANRERQYKLAKIRIAKYIETRRKLLIELKNKPCRDCGEYYPPWVMDFDHKEDYTKLGNISYMFLRGIWKVDKLMEEIKKCDLVCSNCHRKRTYVRGTHSYDKILKQMKLKEYKLNWQS